MTRRPVSAASVVLTGLLALGMVLLTAEVSSARSQAVARTSAATVSSAVFGAAPRTATHTVAAPLQLTWTSPALGPQYFDVRNTGQLALTGAGYAVTVVNEGRGTPRVVLTACVGGRWTAGVCLGSEQLQGSFGVGSASSASVVGIGTGQDLHVRAALSQSNLRTGERVRAQVSVTVSTGATRQVRAATTTSS